MWERRSEGRRTCTAGKPTAATPEEEAAIAGVKALGLEPDLEEVDHTGHERLFRTGLTPTGSVRAEKDIVC